MAGLSNFPKVQSEAVEVTQEFSMYHHSLYFDESGNLVHIGDKINGYNVITIDTCNERNRSLYLGNVSDPSVFLLN
jgi:hypothetical protein